MAFNSFIIYTSGTVFVGSLCERILACSHKKENFYLLLLLKQLSASKSLQAFKLELVHLNFSLPHTCNHFLFFLLRRKEKSLEMREKLETVKEFYSMSVPQHFVGKTFEELFLALLPFHTVCVGIYRDGARTDAPCNYVCTNPEPGTYLFEGDCIYLLGSRQQEAQITHLGILI
jgi:hypothetical protein